LLHLQHNGIYHGNICLESLHVVDNMILVLGDLRSAARVPYQDPFNFGCVTDSSEGNCRRLLRTTLHGGDVRYRDPKTAEGAFDAFASDIFSAGAVLFVLLTGITPSKITSTSDAIFTQISRGNLKELLKSWKIALSAEACDLLQGMMWRNPSKRPSLREIIEHPWISKKKLQVPLSVSYGASELQASCNGHKRVDLINSPDNHKQVSMPRPSLDRKVQRSLRLEHLLARSQGQSKNEKLNDSLNSQDTAITERSIDQSDRRDNDHTLKGGIHSERNLGCAAEHSVGQPTRLPSRRRSKSDGSSSSTTNTASWWKKIIG
jgi:serine/threonine protein kinase